MTKAITLLTCFLMISTITIVKAQNFQGQATYETKRSISDIQFQGSGMTPAMKDMFMEKLKKSMEKTFILTFDKTTSLYEEPQLLGAPVSGLTTIVASNATGDEKQYKNIKDQKVMIEKDFFGKEFLIVDALPHWDWKLTNETKQIGGYTAYKATALLVVTEEAKAAYEKSQQEQSNKATQMMQEPEPQDKLVTAWYTPDIPVSQGPEEYWGLPGLILEVNDGNNMILCSKIVLNPKEKATIKMPKKGKVVSKKEYTEIIEKQMEKMKDGKGNIRIEMNK